MPQAWTAEDEAELKALEKEALEASDQDPQDGGQEEDPADPDNAGGEEPTGEQDPKETSPASSTGEQPTEPAKQPEGEDGLDPEDKELINNPNLSRRTRKRLQDLSKKAKEAEQLRKELAELKNGKKPEGKPDGGEGGEGEEDPFAEGKVTPTTDKPKAGELPWDEKEELSVEDVRAMSRQEAADLLRQQREIETFADTIKSDCREVVQTYPQLNEDDPAYNQALDRKIARGYQLALKTYPRLRFKRYVEVEMQPILELLEANQQDTATIVKKQADDQALPTSGGGKGPGKVTLKDLDNMSLEEMEAALPKAANYDSY